MHFETERIIVRDLEEGDWPDLYLFRSDPLVARYTEFDVETAEDTQRWVKECVVHNHANPRFAHLGCLVLKDTMKLVGYLGVGYPSDRTIGDRDFGYSLRRDYWGRGLMPEAVRGLLRFCFDSLHVKSVFAQCYKINKQSARVMEKAGMEFSCEVIDKEQPSLRYMALSARWLPRHQTDFYRDLGEPEALGK